MVTKTGSAFVWGCGAQGQLGLGVMGSKSRVAVGSKGVTSFMNLAQPTPIRNIGSNQFVQVRL